MIKAKVREMTVLRISKGWSMNELARKSKVAPSTIVKMNQGKSVSAKTAKKIADALQVEVLEIFTILND